KCCDHIFHCQSSLTLLLNPHLSCLLKGLEADSFKKSEKCKAAQIFRNQENHVLIVRPEDDADATAAFEPMTDEEIRNEPGISLNIHIYQDTNLRGLPVAFSTKWNGETYIMQIVKDGSNMRVVFRVKFIPGEKSDMLFFKTPFSKADRQFYRFESSLEQGYFLAFERNERDRVTQLVIKRIDGIDESIKLHTSPLPRRKI
uniref:Interleukin 18 n=1 Tax=Podarcis muralis TaxID=64176 RepID=A0A670KGJ9_PODMU